VRLSAGESEDGMNEQLSVCVGCKYATWSKTASGRRHPSGSGRCLYEFPETPLPLWLANSYATYARTQPRTVREALTGHRAIFYKATVVRECPAREGA
jgi:hypothetical protein